MIYVLIASIGTMVVLIFSIVARVPTYHVAPTFLLPLMWAPYFLRRQLRLRPLDYALFVAAILFHDAGAFGFYQHSPFPFSFDIAVHFYFAFAVAFALHHLIEKTVPVLRRWQVNLTTLLFMMGFGALHEIMEYLSYLMLGEEKGMLKPSTSYFFDTQRDLTNNLLGTLLALILITAYRASVSRREEARVEGITREEEPSPAGSLHTASPHGHAGP